MPEVSRLCFFVPGPPRGKGRPRIAKHGGVFTPKRTREYEKLVRSCATSGAPAEPWTGPISIQVIALFRRPKKPSRDYPPRPDTDNILKAISDSINKLVYADDSQIIQVSAAKRYALGQEEEGVKVRVENLTLASGGPE